MLGLAVIQKSDEVSRIEYISGYSEIVLIIMEAMHLQAQVRSSWHWALVASIFVGFFSRLPWPVVVLGYLTVVFIAQALQQRVWQAPLLAMFSVIFLGTLFMHLVTFAALRLAGVPLFFDEVVGLITLPSLLLNLLFAIPIYAFMRDLANWVYPEQETV
jgi:hypothetical protein